MQLAVGGSGRGKSGGGDFRSQEPGAVSRELGAGSQEPGARSQELRDGSEDPRAESQEPSREPGVSMSSTHTWTVFRDLGGR